MRILLLMGACFLSTALPVASPAQLQAGQTNQAKREQEFRAAQEKAIIGDHAGEEALAEFYYKGVYVAKDLAKAATYYRKAAEGGRKYSQWRLGVMLDLGQGVKENPTEAITWFQKSAAQGFASGYTSMGLMYVTGRGTPQDFALAYAAYRKGAQLGAAQGFYDLGVMHANGEGVPKDNVEAYAWYAVASSRGDETAKAKMEKAGAGLSAEQLQRANERINAIKKEFGLN